VDDSVEPGASRSRLAARGIGERRRIERALHDGVQQDLIALSVRLQLLRDLVGDERPAALELLDELQRDTRDALERLRALASEIYPPLLDAAGLPDALREAGRHAQASVRVAAGGLGRYPAEVEAAVYFVCRAVLDAMGPGTRAVVGVQEGERELLLEIEGVEDVDPVAAEDLAAAAGGSVVVEPTRVRAAIPLR
jgi:signal transduction histidine kinase